MGLVTPGAKSAQSEILSLVPLTNVRDSGEWVYSLGLRHAYLTSGEIPGIIRIETMRAIYTPAKFKSAFITAYAMVEYDVVPGIQIMRTI